MNDTPENKPDKKPETEEELRDAIVTFEQILEAIPSDRLALETLSDAYEQLGDHVKALEYYIRLGEVLLEEGDRESAPAVTEKLQSIGARDTTAQEVAAALLRLAEPDPEEEEAKKKAPVKRRKAIDITAELALAWNLVQAGELSQDDYSSVVQDLTESSSKNNDVPVTVLHVLRDRAFKGYEKVMGFLSQNSGLPIIPLAGFEVQKDAISLLPDEIMKQRGALVYELMGKEALVAILNPYDTELREEIEGLTGRTCHYFLVSADEYDHYLDAIRKALIGEKKPEEPPPSEAG